MAKFLTDLDAKLKDDDSVWVLDSPLVYESDLVGIINVPTGFQTDFASVPRLPIIYSLFGDRAHRESVLHDFLYRSDSTPCVDKETADGVFYEAMALREKPFFIRYPMWWGVVLFGGAAFHQRRVGDKL